MKQLSNSPLLKGDEDKDYCQLGGICNYTAFYVLTCRIKSFKGIRVIQ